MIIASFPIQRIRDLAIDTRQEEVNVKEYFAKEIRTVLQRGGKRLKLETDTLKN